MTTKPGEASRPEAIEAPTYEQAPPTMNMEALRRNRGEPAMVKGTLQGMGALTRPAPAAPNVVVTPSLQMDAARAPEPKAPPPPTDVMPSVAKRRAENAKEGSDLPLKIGIGVVALVIVALLVALAYGIATLGTT